MKERKITRTITIVNVYAKAYSNENDEVETTAYTSVGYEWDKNKSTCIQQIEEKYHVKILKVLAVEQRETVVAVSEWNFWFGSEMVSMSDPITKEV